MGKKLAVLLFAALMVFSSVAAHAAATDELVQGAGQKLCRGVINTCTGWVEIPAQIMKGWNRGFGGDENNKAAGAFVGIFTGLSHAMGRTLSGASDLSGFWAADPKSNENVGLPLDAEFVWEEGKAYDMCKPSFNDATLAPIGNKIGRGLGNVLLGFVEMPGQIVKGYKLKTADVGIVKGIWYAISREIDGAYDLATCLLPNPVDTKALAFDEKWPWDALFDGTK